eukprot:361734-Chlamydomonas_euryale.AAC.2
MACTDERMDVHQHDCLTTCARAMWSGTRSQSQSQSYMERNHEGYACVERSKIEKIKERGCRKGRELGNVSLHVQRGLPTTPPSPTSPSATTAAQPNAHTESSQIMRKTSVMHPRRMAGRVQQRGCPSSYICYECNQAAPSSAKL